VPDYRTEQIPRKKVTWPAQERKHFGAAELSELAATIRVHGILEAIGVAREGDGYIGLWGQRRWMAAELAGLETIPAVVRDKPRNEAEALEIRLIENMARQGLAPLEQAAGLDQLMKATGSTASDVARRVGMKPATVTKSLSLLHLPEPIREKIDAGLISAGAGYELARVEDPRLQMEFAEKVAGGTLTRDGISGFLKREKRNRSKPSSVNSARVAAVLGAGRTIVLSGSGITSLDVMIQWLEELLGRARKVRPQGIEIRTFVKMLKDQAKTE